MEGYEALVTSLETAFSGIAGQLTSSVSVIAPVAITVVGAMMIVTFGVKAFKKIAG